ncbi:MAG TPA: cation diffusion facilitator family transporter [Acidimicrobiales bacterium]|nr:cation diffusion facilitator family transporter [Acidimicrobiales bacterium]
MRTTEAPVPPAAAASTGGREIRALKLAVALYVVVFAIKLGAYLVTGVMALFAEALHTVGDVFVSGFLLVALIWSRREADETHMFGYGRAQAAAALVAATLFISFTALRLYEEAIPRLLRPEEVTYDYAGLAIAVLVVSMLLAGAPLVALVRDPPRGPAAKAQMWELVNDELGLVAALVGTSLALAGQEWADPLAAVVIATIITWKAVSLLRENLSLLIGRSPGADVLDAVTHAALSTPGVLGVHELRAERLGPETVHLGMHLEVRPGTPVEDADQIATAARDAIHHVVAGAYCVIHIDPARPHPVVAHDG